MWIQIRPLRFESFFFAFFWFALFSDWLTSTKKVHLNILNIYKSCIKVHCILFWHIRWLIWPAYDMTFGFLFGFTLWWWKTKEKKLSNVEWRKVDKLREESAQWKKSFSSADVWSPEGNLRSWNKWVGIIKAFIRCRWTNYTNGAVSKVIPYRRAKSFRIELGKL